MISSTYNSKLLLAKKNANGESNRTTRINSAFSSAEQTVDLSNLNLNSLPNVASNSTSGNLALLLNSNLFTCIPPNIEMFLNLEILEMKDCKILEVGPDISKLSKLKELHLNGNQISFVHPNLKELKNLNKLFLHDNQLKSIPSEIGQLKLLTELHLSNNFLELLPPEIGGLSRLSILKVSHCKLRSIPNEICNLVGLRDLQLGYNQITWLPEHLGKLKHLFYFNCQNNLLKDFPYSMGECTSFSKIEGINISSNPFTDAHLIQRSQMGVLEVMQYLRERWIKVGGPEDPNYQKQTSPQMVVSDQTRQKIETLIQWTLKNADDIKERLNSLKYNLNTSKDPEQLTNIIETVNKVEKDMVERKHQLPSIRTIPNYSTETKKVAEAKIVSVNLMMMAISKAIANKDIPLESFMPFVKFVRATQDTLDSHDKRLEEVEKSPRSQVAALPLEHIKPLEASRSDSNPERIPPSFGLTPPEKSPLGQRFQEPIQMGVDQDKTNGTKPIVKQPLVRANTSPVGTLRLHAASTPVVVKTRDLPNFGALNINNSSSVTFANSGHPANSIHNQNALSNSSPSLPTSSNGLTNNNNNSPNSMVKKQMVTILREGAAPIRPTVSQPTLAPTLSVQPVKVEPNKSQGIFVPFSGHKKPEERVEIRPGISVSTPPSLQKTPLVKAESFLRDDKGDKSSHNRNLRNSGVTKAPPMIREKVKFTNDPFILPYNLLFAPDPPVHLHPTQILHRGNSPTKMIPPPPPKAKMKK